MSYLSFYKRAGGDANFSSVELLVHGTGTNGATTAPDTGSHARTSTQVGNAQISTAQSTLGQSASMLFDNNGDGFKYAFPVTAVASSSVTVEFFVRLTAITASDDDTFWDVEKNDTTVGWYCRMSYNGSTKFLTVTAVSGFSTSVSAPFVAGTWHHVAYARDGATNTNYIFFDGSLLHSSVLAGSDITFGDLYIGRHAPASGGGASAASVNGHMQDFRWTQGVARYTSAFTPTTVPFPDF